MLFVASCFSYGDRIALSVGGVLMQKAMALSPAEDGAVVFRLWMGVCGGSIAVGRPAGPFRIEAGLRHQHHYLVAVCVAHRVCRLRACGSGPSVSSSGCGCFPGLAQSPVFPGNGRIVAAWFPTAERGRASAIFNASQYFSLFAFGGLFGWMTQKHGWQSCFWFMGVAGFVLAFVWWKTVYNVPDHPMISRPEIDCIEQGGGLVNVDSSQGAAA